MSKILKLTIGVLAFAIVMEAKPISYLHHGFWTSAAEARVGRPATPVSVAGVARRTTRRCAAGVYDC
jgi:hypothetical protein